MPVLCYRLEHHGSFVFMALILTCDTHFRSFVELDQTDSITWSHAPINTLHFVSRHWGHLESNPTPYQAGRHGDMWPHGTEALGQKAAPKHDKAQSSGTAAEGRGSKSFKKLTYTNSGRSLPSRRKTCNPKRSYIYSESWCFRGFLPCSGS